MIALVLANLVACLAPAGCAGREGAAPEAACTAAPGSGEYRVCTDPELRARGEALALVAAQSDDDGRFAETHRTWLATVAEACPSSACLADAHYLLMRRILQDVPGSGDYVRFRNLGDLVVAPLPGGRFGFALTAMTPRAEGMGGAYVTIVGIAASDINHGDYRRGDCHITFERFTGGWTLEQEGECANGADVSGDYAV